MPTSVAFKYGDSGSASWSEKKSHGNELAAYSLPSHVNETVWNEMLSFGSLLYQV